MSDSALRSAGFQERRDFPFCSLQRSFFFFFFFLFPRLLVYPILPSVLLLCSCFFLFFLFFGSLWVWLKVILHTGWLTFREERGGSEAGKRTREKSEGAARRTGCPHYSAVITFYFRHDWGSLKGRVGLQPVRYCRRRQQ